MSVAKHIPQDHCLLFAIYQNSQDDTFRLQQLLKKFPKAYQDVGQLLAGPGHCAQNTCIVVTNNSPLLLKGLKEKIELLKKESFFLLSIDAHPFKLKGPAKKLIKQNRLLNLSGLNLKDSITQIKRELKALKKEVNRHLKVNVQLSQKGATLSIDFLHKFNTLLKKYHTDPKLRTPFLAEKLGISQSTLERRCLKLTGKKPNHILLEFRLSRAYELAAHTRTNFSEIATLCGFGSASYFSVRFTEFYKLKPSHVRLESQRRTAS